MSDPILEINVLADGEAAEAVSEVFNRYNGGEAGGAVIEIAGFNDRGEMTTPVVTVRTFLRPEPGRDERRQHIEEGLWHLRQVYWFGETHLRELMEEDWANAWKQHYHTLRIGRHFVIKPSWESYQPQPGDRVIELDPGMAFGTGLHPTTRLCLSLLEDHLQPGQRVFDLGTGSGILAIGAVLLGAGEVVACDVDPVAVTVARENTDLNHNTAQIRYFVGSLPPTPPGQPWDLVICNILAEVIVDLLGQNLARHVAPHGRLLLSGIINLRAPRVIEALQQHGMAVLEQRDEGDWVGLLAGWPA